MYSYSHLYMFLHICFSMYVWVERKREGRRNGKAVSKGGKEVKEGVICCRNGRYAWRHKYSAICSLQPGVLGKLLTNSIWSEPACLETKDYDGATLTLRLNEGWECLLKADPHSCNLQLLKQQNLKLKRVSQHMKKECCLFSFVLIRSRQLLCLYRICYALAETFL